MLKGKEKKTEKAAEHEKHRKEKRRTSILKQYC